MENRVAPGLAAAASRWSAGATSPSPGLAGARLTTHWAVQIVSAAGWTLAPPSPDDSQGSLEWCSAEDALAGLEIVRAGRRARAGLRLADLTLLVMEQAQVRAELALPGKTLDEAMAWLDTALTQSLAATVSHLERPRHPLPPSPVGQGATFDRPPPASLAELASWYSSADRVLRAIAANTPGASPVRCWPHHFDLATLIRLDPPDAPKEMARSIGVGLSPGDAGIPEPYWYVIPRPYPATKSNSEKSNSEKSPSERSPSEQPAPPRLPAGHWQKEGWTGAALTASELVATPTRAAGDGVAAFLSTALAACRGLLDAQRAP
jgi:hypothetical protein